MTTASEPGIPPHPGGGASRGRVSARLVAGVLGAAESLGVDGGAALAAVGIDPDVLGDPEARIPIEQEEALWGELACRSGDPCFGLHAQLRMPAGAVDVLDFAVRSSATLGDALRNLVRFNRLAHDLAEFELRREGDAARLVQRFRGADARVGWQVADYSVGGLVVVMRQLVGDDWTPREVRIAHEAPQDPAPYVALLGVLPRFGGATNEVLFDAALLARPVRGSDPRLNDILTRHAEALVARLPRADDWLGRVRALVAERLDEGDPSIESVATPLGVGPRTLQRRLQEAGTTLRELVASLRAEMALELLGREAFGVAEVAYLLGYSEPSAFHRAFKRWHGITPAEYRRRPS
jgi:AraC-like DNA-binding protein